jgi:anti-sigma B factor antagonist
MARKLDIKQATADKGITILHLKGVIDAHTYHQLSKLIEDLFELDTYKIILDLEEIDYMSSSGVSVILGSLPKAQENKGDIVLLNPTEKVDQVFQLFGLHDMLKIALTKRAALDYFK